MLTAVIFNYLFLPRKLSSGGKLTEILITEIYIMHLIEVRILFSVDLYCAVYAEALMM
jgi:hypothetical protein